MKLSEKQKKHLAILGIFAGAAIPGGCGLGIYAEQRIDSIKGIVPEVETVERLERSIANYENNYDLVSTCPRLQETLQTYQTQLDSLLERCEVREARQQIDYYESFGPYIPFIVLGSMFAFSAAVAYLIDSK